jgi:hypothetical protein
MFLHAETRATCDRAPDVIIYCVPGWTCVLSSPRRMRHPKTMKLPAAGAVWLGEPRLPALLFGEPSEAG